MRSLFFFVLIICSTNAQNGRILQLPSYDNGHGWDIRLAVPGKPGNDYPTLSSIPRTRFTCAGKDPGYYADVDTNCQVFRVCTVGATYGFQSFLCPNGTLFNQAVFVCDWWMNVICNKSDELIRNGNEQFDNLKLGPQLMKDIKKMLTHPVRNPVNTISMKSKVIVMQNYKPPTGQLFPNGALLTPPERPPSHIYFPTKAIHTALLNNDYRLASLAYSASTPNPQYIPPFFNTFTPTTVRNVEILQRLNDRKTQNDNVPNPISLPPETGISNGHAGQIPLQSRYSNVNNNFSGNQPMRQLQKYKELRNIQKSQNTNNLIGINAERDQKDTQNVRNIENFNKQIRNSNRGSTDNINTSNQFKQQQSLPVPTKPPTILTSSTKKSYDGVLNQVNSDIIPPTILTKTVAYSRLVKEPNQGSPKSRITFKTWVLKPPIKAKLIASSTPYTYSQPNNAQVQESELEAPYDYNNSFKSVTVDNELQSELEGYNYPNPTTSLLENFNEQQVSRLYLTPTTSLPPAFNELLLTTSTTEPLDTSLSLDSVSPQSSARQYLPPTAASSTVSYRYLQPTPNSALKKLSRYQNAQFIANPTPPARDYITNNKNKFSPLLSVKTNIDDSYNNLSFSDILSKEKLDITINEIVNDSNDILQTASPESYGQYIEDFPTKTSNGILSEKNSTKEELTEFRDSRVPKPAKLIAVPSTELEPPIENFNSYQSVNKMSNLPFFQETPLPTIERTVSLKITIPESIANYLFKTHYDAKLEILNTDSSNYLVLKNTDDKNLDFTPLGKLRWDGNSNLSSSQAFVFSLVVDSINAAKKYNTIIQDNLISTTPSRQQQFQAVNSNELGRISNTISKLTASQYSSKNLKQSNNINTEVYQPDAYIDISKQNKTFSHHNKQTRGKASNFVSHSSENYSPKPSGNLINNLNKISLGNTNKIYSGQLYKFPVPEVTRQIINSPNPANSNIVIESDFNKVKSEHIVIPKNSIKKPLSSESPIDVKSNVENLQTQSFPSAKLQVTTSTEYPQSHAKHNEIFVNDLLNLRSGLTAQIQDKITGTVLHPSDRNKFITYRKDQSYNLYSKLLTEKNSNVVSNMQNEPKKEQEMQSSNYPDLITFHFIPSNEQNHNNNNFLQELQKYRLSENNNFDENNGNADISYLSSPIDVTHNAHNVVNSDLTKQRQSINRLYEGPSSYSAPQSSIGNLITKGTLNYNGRIEDLDENSNFNGYLKERPSRQFNF